MATINDRFGAFARLINAFASSPAATAFAFALVALWAISGPRFHYSDFWQLIMNTISAVITFLMVFVLNNAQSRDTGAINAKLDAIIFAMDNADNRLIALEERPESEAKAAILEIRTAVNEADESIETAGEKIAEVRQALDEVKMVKDEPDV